MFPSAGSRAFVLVEHVAMDVFGGQAEGRSAEGVRTELLRPYEPRLELGLLLHAHELASEPVVAASQKCRRDTWIDVAPIVAALHSETHESLGRALGPLDEKVDEMLVVGRAAAIEHQ